MLVFDIETDGLLRGCKEILCMAMGSPSDKENILQFDNRSILSGVVRLMNEDSIVGHNIISFDIPAIQKFYPMFNPVKVIDTLVVSRLLFPDISSNKALEKLNARIPDNLMKLKYSHSLEAWGYRLGVLKGDFGKSKGLEAWTRCSYELMEYNKQDVAVTIALYEYLKGCVESQEALELEHQVATIISRQERYGFSFDMAKAWEFYGMLSKKKTELVQQLRSIIPPWKDVDKILVPKVNNERLGYIKGVPVTKWKITEFNPGSREHIARILKERYSWEPEEYTDTGKVMIDESILKPLPWPEAKLCEEYLLITKRLSQLADGESGWLRLVDQSSGRVHGAVITNGAVTGRMTHHSPNMAQVPAVRAPYGKFCRELFKVPSGKKLIGCDAAALELRCLAHFMATYDGGAYAKSCVEGKKEEGTDVHSLTQKAIAEIVEWVTGEYLELPSIKWTREEAKTWFYAYIYGAGNAKLGLIITGVKGSHNQEIGAKSRELFEANLPALGRLQEAVRKAVEKRGYLLGLDKRKLHVRSPHAALNTLLQSAGAIVMKKALVILDANLKAAGYKPGVDYEFVANIHDEWQIEVASHLVNTIGPMAKDSIRLAGEYFKFNCPLDGEWRAGDNWKETH